MNELTKRIARLSPKKLELLKSRLAAELEAQSALRDERAEKRLVAYIVPAGPGGVEAGELRDFLRRQLPEYMIPSAFLRLEKIPLTPSGKVDLRALPAPEDAAPEPVEVGDVRYTTTEEALARVWTEILRVKRVLPGDNFFDLGGHSLLAMQLISRVREQFGVDISVRRLFEAPTLAALSLRLDARLNAGQQRRVPPLVPVPRAGGLPLSFAQQRLWFLEQMRPGNTAYNIPVALRLSGRLDVRALEQSLNEIVRRHEVLRTNFRWMKGEPVQVVQSFTPEPLVLEDLSGLSDAERESAARELAYREAARPFRLESGRMIRTTLLRLEEQEHVLLMTVHHIAADDWSFGVLIRELSALYRSFSSGEPSALPELQVQYADFAAWQRRWLTGELLEEQMAYWRRQLEGAPVLTGLPTDRPRPAVQSARGSIEVLWLDARLTHALKQLSRREGTTLYMTLLGAFLVLLHRYSQQEDIIVGSPIANRTRPEIEELIGFFINTLALRTDLSGNPSYRELLRRVKEVTLEAYAHQDVPFEKLVEELQPERSLGHMPLVQVLFSLQNSTQEALELPGLRISGLEAENETAKFDLVLNLSEAGEELGGALRYSTDLYDAATMRGMLAHFQTMLAAIVENPDARISTLPLLTTQERARLLKEWTPEQAHEFAHDTPLHLRFEAQAGRRPQATALVFGEQRLTYAELNARANRLAHRLRELGVGPEVRVGLLLERSPAVVVCMLAVLKAGGAYVPFDPTYPRERLNFMLTDAGLSLLLTIEKLAGKLDQPTMRLLLLDDEAGEIARRPEHNLENLTLPENAAYVIYTSGSTGRPKGVLVGHAQVARLFSATDENFRFDERDVWTLFHSYAFDFSVWEMWGALLYGGRLVIVSYEVSREPEEFYRLLAREAVTVLSQTPSAFRQLIAAEESLGVHAGLALRLVIFGGEALEPHMLRTWFERHGDEEIRLVNMYGITETTVHVTYRPLTKADLEAAHRSPIGKPIADLGIYLLDGELQPVPAGIPGEIYVGGAGLARGYLGRPELTAERFVPHPFDARGGSRLYRSGDLARYLPCGELEYIGRADQQVKIRGHRVEPGEIEAALLNHERVRQCIVMAREDEPGDKRLVAYLVSASRDGEATPGVEELREFLRGKLPEQMIPAAFVTLESLPLTPHGKIDLRALPAPGRLRPQLGREYRAPRGTLEMMLAEMWREILKVERVGAEDNFFDLGGDSIKGAIFINRLQERLGEIVHVVTIFNYPALAGLARYLEDQYTDAVARICGSDAVGGRARAGAVVGPVRGIDERKVAEARLIINPLPARPSEGATAKRTKNPQAIFVLSAPRSGSTLFRVMLAGHPALFAPPELELLSFNTLEERQRAFRGPNGFWLEGTIRAIMELKGYEAEEARSLMRAFEERGLTTQEFYRQMQSWLGQTRLVDKTPSYALHPSILSRAEEDFEDALYIHLLRHPLGMIRSFEEAKLDQIFFRYEHGFSRRELAELIWLISNQNIFNFLSRVPATRQHRVRFEELLAQPEAVMSGVCRFLGIEPHADMLQPYKDKGRRMTDGIHAESRMLGDVKFHQYTSIDARAASRWRERETGDAIGRPTRALAAALGYETEERGGPGASTAEAEREAGARRVAVGLQSEVVNIQPRGTKRPLFFVHPGAGDPSDYLYLSRYLGDDQPFYGLPGFDLRRPHASVEDKAARAVRSLRELQPRGPYLLGGWSFGALVAFEAAQQLQGLGEEVGQLFLLDPMTPLAASVGPALTETTDPLLAAAEVAAVIGWDTRELFESIARLAPSEQLKRLYDEARTTRLLPPGVTVEKFADWLLMYHAKLLCSRAYRPRAYAGHISILEAIDERDVQERSAAPEDSADPFKAWRSLSSRPVEVLPVPGTHQTMVLEPHAEVLAVRLKSILETVRQS